MATSTLPARKLPGSSGQFKFLAPALAALDPHNPDILYSLGLLHLLRGEWLAGWAGCEQRWQGSDRAATDEAAMRQLAAAHFSG